MSQDPYAAFASSYDLIPSKFDSHEEEVIGFFRRLFKQHAVRTVLDCACGTGRDLLLFHSLRCKVVGSDVSPAMLARAQENLARHGLSLPLHLADYRDLPSHFAERFDAVACLSTSLEHMPDDQQALAALRSMRAVLREGGVLVLEQGFTDSLWSLKPASLPVVATRDISRRFDLDYLGGRDLRITIVDTVVSPAHADVAPWSGVLHLLLKDDQERLLAEAGFRSVEFYGGFSFEPYDTSSSERLVTVARR